MSVRDESFRLLIYSHDTFGLGHLSRCRAIAHKLAGHREDISVLILSGSPIIGAFDFRRRVDFVRFPGVVKLRNGTYSARGLDISIEHAIQIRENLIQCSATSFRPHIFLVDKEPLGLRGEVASTLKLLKAQGTKLVLGLRDILDDVDQLTEEWDRKAAMPALSDIYDHIWVYGCEDVYDPLNGLDVPPHVRDKMLFTGYLRKDPAKSATLPADLPDDFILVTTGGGGDGSTLIDWVLHAYEHDPTLPDVAYIVLGPFMPTEDQAQFRARAEKLKNVRVAASFVPGLEAVMSKARAVVAMGGYNTVCEILSADKPALIVPRTVPRLEQFIRAERLSELGLVRMLLDGDVRPPGVMARALRDVVKSPPPSRAAKAGLLTGFDTLIETVDSWLPRKLKEAPVTKAPRIRAARRAS